MIGANGYCKIIVYEIIYAGYAYSSLVDAYGIRAACIHSGRGGKRGKKGSLPARQLKLVLAWNELHMDELMQNWELAKDDRPLNAIAPLM